jgi:hypothetical protein
MSQVENLVIDVKYLILTPGVQVSQVENLVIDVKYLLLPLGVQSVPA